MVQKEILKDKELLKKINQFSEVFPDNKAKKSQINYEQEVTYWIDKAKSIKRAAEEKRIVDWKLIGDVVLH